MREMKNARMKSYRVMLGDKVLDIVYYLGQHTEEEIKKSIIEHDGYDENIRVEFYENILP